MNIEMTNVKVEVNTTITVNNLLIENLEGYICLRQHCCIKQTERQGKYKDTETIRRIMASWAAWPNTRISSKASTPSARRHRCAHPVCFLYDIIIMVRRPRHSSKKHNTEQICSHTYRTGLCSNALQMQVQMRHLHLHLHLIPL